jgi:hypothetical protein
MQDKSVTVERRNSSAGFLGVLMNATPFLVCASPPIQPKVRRRCIDATLRTNWRGSRHWSDGAPHFARIILQQTSNRPPIDRRAGTAPPPINRYRPPITYFQSCTFRACRPRVYL